jgi:hypothetical protein
VNTPRKRARGAAAQYGKLYNEPGAVEPFMGEARKWLDELAHVARVDVGDAARVIHVLADWNCLDVAERRTVLLMVAAVAK